MLRFSPVVGIFGLRQAGKTTFLHQTISQHGGSYETFDRAAALQASQDAPEQFLSRTGLLAIDEVQKAPWIFPAIKDLVGTRRKPGRFLLTGSVRFTLKKEIRESLTGRIVLKELLPFSLAEAHQRSPSTFLENLMALQRKGGFERRESHDTLDRFVSALRHTSLHEIERHGHHGGLPIPCFSRDARARTEWFKAYMETLITRDLTLVDSSLNDVDFRSAMTLMDELATAQGDMIFNTRLAARSGLSVVRVKRVLRALEALSVIDFLRPQVRGPKSARGERIEWKDPGLWAHVRGGTNSPFEDRQHLLLILGSEFRAQINLMNEPATLSFHRGRDGSMVSWIVQAGRHAIVIEYLPMESPKPYSTRALRHACAVEKTTLGIVLGPSHIRPRVLAPSLWHLPISVIF